MAKQVKLTAERRTATGRSAVRKLKAQGMVPAIIYGAKDKAETLQVSVRDINAMLSHASGENILVESDQIWSIDDLGAALVIQTADGQLMRLDALKVAAPCVEFSHFAHLSDEPLTSDQLRTTLQFLDGGMRGFYARLADGQPSADIRAGDRVFVS